MAESTSVSRLVIQGVDNASEVVANIGKKIGGTLGDIASASSGLANVLTTGLGTALGIVGAGAINFVADAGAKLIGFIGDSFSGAMEAAEGQRKLSDAIERLGKNAPISVEKAEELAEKYKDLAGGSDDAIVAAQTMLLKYKNLTRDAFEPALQTALDLSAALGIGLTEASDMVGKALVAPGEGLGRLKSAGVAFTDNQEKLIKRMVQVGNVAGAQKFILQKLAETTGNAAASKANTLSGQMAILKETIADAGEGIAGEFLPILNSLGKEVITTVLPAVKNFASDAVNLFKGIADSVKERWPQIKQTISGVFNALGRFWNDSAKPVLNFFLSALGQVVNFVMASWPSVKEGFNTVFTALAGYWNDSVKPTFNFLLATLGNVVKFVISSWPAVQEGFRNAFTTLVGYWNDYAKPIFNFFVATLENVVKFVITNWPAVQEEFRNVFTALSGYWNDSVKPTLNFLRAALGEVVKLVITKWPAIQKGFKTVFNGLVSFWNDPVKPLLNFLMSLLGEVVNLVVTNWPEIKETFKTVFVALESFSNDFAKPTLTFLVNALRAVVNFVITSWPTIKEVFKAVFSALAFLWNNLAKPTLIFLYSSLKEVVKFVTTNWPAIEKEFRTVFNGLSIYWNSSAKPTLNALISVLKEVVRVVVTSWPYIQQEFNTVFTNVGIVVRTTIGVIQTLLNTVIAFSDGWNRTWTSVGVFFRRTWDDLIKFMNDLVNTFSRIGESISKAFLASFMNLGEMLRNLVLAPIRSIVKTIRDALTPLVNAPIIGELAKEAIRSLPEFGEGGTLPAGQFGIVGEKGPELVSFNRTARIIPIPEMLNALKASSTESPRVINVNVSVERISSDIDIERMAYRVAEVIGQRI